MAAMENHFQNNIQNGKSLDVIHSILCNFIFEDWHGSNHYTTLNSITPPQFQKRYQTISGHISITYTQAVPGQWWMAIWSILVHHVQCVSALTTARQQSTSWGRCRQSVVIKGSGSLSIPISTPAASHDTRSHSPIYHNFQTNWT